MPATASERASRVFTHILKYVLPLVAGASTFAAFELGADRLIGDLQDPVMAGLMFAWLFGAMLWGAFGVVRHADRLAEALGEPYGTLVLTLAVVGIEVALIAAVMLTGEAAPTLARDTMFAVLMMVLNGLAGASLLLGGLRHGQQDYNLPGARAFIAVLLPLAVFALVLPNFTTSTPNPTFDPYQAAFFACVTVLLYAVFLGIQTTRHRTFFEEPEVSGDGEAAADAFHPDQVLERKPTAGFHAAFLILTLIPIILLAERLAKIVDFGIVEVAAPPAIGGVIIALLVLMPEGLAALRAARANRLQRSVNLLLGAALSTIGLTVPAALAISLVIAQPITLGLDDTSMVMLFLTLLMSSMTFGGIRTSVLQGAVHLVLFFAYLMLIFSP
ncbi:sodium-potassium/proton antiporter ChaA [Nisaea sp.]|uniref:calcium:proton antiporter n=1 Tax=Nisaea sp. TaxID=2024842 RepID=UPI0032ED5833